MDLELMAQTFQMVEGAIALYNMKTPYQTKSKQDKDDKSEKLRRRKKKKKSQPLTSLRPPSNKFSGRKKKNRESLDFFTRRQPCLIQHVKKS